jgi:hypothetical protein
VGVGAASVTSDCLAACFLGILALGRGKVAGFGGGGLRGSKAGLCGSVVKLVAGPPGVDGVA